MVSLLTGIAKLAIREVIITPSPLKYFGLIFFRLDKISPLKKERKCCLILTQKELKLKFLLSQSFVTYSKYKKRKDEKFQLFGKLLKFIPSTTSKSSPMQPNITVEHKT